MGALISYTNLADDATVSNASSDGSNVLPASNVQLRQVGKVYRQTLSTASPLESVHLDFDLGSAQDISYVGIIGHNVSAGSYEVRLGSTLGSGNVATDSGTLWQGPSDQQKYQHVIFNQTYSARYVRVTLTPDAGQDVDIGRVWIDDPWTPDVSVEFEQEVIDESDNERSTGQSAYSFERPRIRMNRMRFPKLTEGQAYGDSTDSTAKCAHAMDITVGTHSPIICIPQTTGADATQMTHSLGIYGSIRRSTPIKNYAAKDGSGGWLCSKAFDVVEER